MTCRGVRSCTGSVDKIQAGVALCRLGEANKHLLTLGTVFAGLYRLVMFSRHFQNLVVKSINVIMLGFG